MKIVFLFGLIALCQCVQFSLLQRCACSEYGQTLCSAYPYCAWNGTACVDMDCQYLTTAADCTAQKSGYQCKWNTNKCETHTYSCSDITQEDCGEKVYGFDCVWADDKCQDFSCSSASSEDCSPFTCAMKDSDQSCSDPKSVDCSSLSTSATCNQSDGMGNMCYFNDKSECKSYDIFSQSCSDYNDIKDYCNTLCTYVDSTKTCQEKSCSDFTTEEDCVIQLDMPGLKIIPCTWSGTACQESVAADLEKLDILSCMVKTMLNYKWSLDNNKCTACTQFTTNPQFQYLQDYLDGENYGIQIFSIIVGLILILN